MLAICTGTFCILKVLNICPASLLAPHSEHGTYVQSSPNASEPGAYESMPPERTVFQGNWRADCPGALTPPRSLFPDNIPVSMRQPMLSTPHSTHDHAVVKLCLEAFAGEHLLGHLPVKTATPENSLDNFQRTLQSHPFLTRTLETPPFLRGSLRPQKGGVWGKEIDWAGEGWGRGEMENLGNRFLSSMGVGKSCVLPILVPNPSPTLDKNLASMGPGILSSVGVGVWGEGSWGISRLQHYTGYMSVYEKRKKGHGKVVSQRFWLGDAPQKPRCQRSVGLCWHQLAILSSWRKMANRIPSLWGELQQMPPLQVGALLASQPVTSESPMFLDIQELPWQQSCAHTEKHKRRPISMGMFMQEALLLCMGRPNFLSTAVAEILAWATPCRASWWKNHVLGHKFWAVKNF